MTKVETPVPSPVVDEAHLLFEEARRRRRRRWMIGGIVTVMLAAALGVSLLAGPASRPVRPPPAGPRARPQRTTNAPTGVSRSLVLSIGAAGSEIGWALNVSDLYLSTDRGQTWRTVTPPQMSNAAGKWVTSVTGVGTDDVWVGAQGVPGVVAPSQSTAGGDRGDEILRSTDGGSTWTATALPGCLQGCGGNLSLTFVDPLHGFASDGNQFFSTTDGGASWSSVSTLPFDGAAIVFTDTRDGWAQQSGDLVNTASPGTSLYRTTDGGQTWAPASSLPSNGQYQLPTFFTPGIGVVFGFDPSPVVFVTSDGGNSWQPRPVPVTGSAASMAPPASLSAATPRAWFLSWGRSLVETTDAGAHWTTVDTEAAWPSDPGPGPAKGGAWGLHFFSPQDGWAVVGIPPCVAPEGCTGEGLIATHDGGHRWRYLNP